MINPAVIRQEYLSMCLVIKSQFSVDCESRIQGVPKGVSLVSGAHIAL